MRQGSTAHREMFGNHAEINVPTLEVSDVLPIQLLKGESRDVICQLVLSKDLCRLFNSIVLVFDYAYNHATQDQICLTCMRVW